MIEKALDLLEKMHSETRYKAFAFDREKTRAFLRDVIEKGQFISVKDGGIMIGSLSDMFFGPGTIANDILLFVEKEKRRTGIAKDMLVEFIDWAKSHGADSIVVGQTTGVEQKGYTKLMKSIGATQCGVVYEVF